jgi:hypothetical protein
MRNIATKMQNIMVVCIIQSYRIFRKNYIFYWLVILFCNFMISCKNSNENVATNCSDTVVYGFYSVNNTLLSKIILFRYAENNKLNKKVYINNKFKSIDYRVTSDFIKIEKDGLSYPLYSFDEKNRECKNTIYTKMFLPFNVLIPNFISFVDSKNYILNNQSFKIFKFKQTVNYGMGGTFWAYYLDKFDFILYSGVDFKSVIKIMDIKGTNNKIITKILNLEKLILADSSFYDPKFKPLIPFITKLPVKKEISNNFFEMMIVCDSFVKQYHPTYILGSDTMEVSRFTMPPDSINKFLFACIKNHDFRPLKFSAVIFFKQHYEYWKVNRFDYLLGDGEYENNGIVEIMRKAMEIKDDESAFYDFPNNTGEVCKWIQQNKYKIKDYAYVERYLKLKH